jgi:hypothetical protein
MILSLLKVLDSSLNQGRLQLEAKQKISSHTGRVVSRRFLFVLLVFWDSEIRDRRPACCPFVED